MSATSPIVQRSEAAVPISHRGRSRAVSHRAEKHSWLESLKNVFRWYRRAVSAPITEQEQAEWQKTSF